MRFMTRKSLAVFSVLALVLACGVQAADATPNEVPFEEGKGPPPAKPGDGWCLVTIPAKYKTVTEQVTVQPATHYTQVAPAKYETKEETIQVAPEKKVASVVPAKFKTEKVKVKVRDEYETYEVIPAQWDWADEQVVVRAESQTLEVVPASYKTVTEQVEISPAKKYWKTGKDNNCYCFCETPAKFVTVAKEVLDADVQTRNIPVPALTKAIKVRKLVKPAEVKKVTVPAEFIEIDREIVDAPATVTQSTLPARFETLRKEVQTAAEVATKVEIPAKTETVTKQVLETPAKLVWRLVKCDCGQERYKEVPGTGLDSLMPKAAK